MNFDFDTVFKRRGYNSEKWDRFPEDVLPMWVADMDFQSPPAVREALAKLADHGIFGYRSNNDEGQLAVSNWVDKFHHWQVSPEQINLIPSVVNGFNLVAQAVTKPGDGILLITPVYEPFLEIANNGGLEQQEVEFVQKEDGQYSFDLEAFEAAIQPNTKIFMLCNPHNPTGRVFTKVELESLAEICLKNEIYICSDEVHSDLVYPGNSHIPISSISEEVSKITVTVMGVSKTFNLAGLKAAAMIIQDEELSKKIENSTPGLVSWVNSFGYTALLAAYQMGEPWLKELLSYLEENRDFTYEFVNNRLPGIRMAKPQGTYLAWLDCKEAEFAGNPNDFFHQHAKVELNDGKMYGNGGEGFLRLNFGCPRSQLKEALERMEKALIVK